MEQTLQPEPLSVPQTKPQHRNSALDVMRAVAILLVVVSHLFTIDKQYFIHTYFKWVYQIFNVIEIGGWSGVDLFFVLSGFLVSGLLFNEYKKTQTVEPGRFLIRRGFKIYPSFIFFIGFTFIAELLFHKFFNTPSYPAILYVKDLFFVHNYLDGRWGPTWSLDVEEAFYFLLAAYFLYCVKKKKLTLNMIIYTYIVLLIWGLIWRWVAVIQHPVYKFTDHYMYTHFRLDSLFFGVLLSYIYNFHRAQLTAFVDKYKTTIFIVASLCVLPNFLCRRTYNTWISIFLLATNPICYGFLILAALQSKSFIFKNKFLAMVGRSSYAMYLWHPFVNDYLHEFLFHNKSELGFLLYVFTYVAVVIIVGIFITKVIEDPFLRLRDRIYPSKTKTSIIS